MPETRRALLPIGRKPLRQILGRGRCGACKSFDHPLPFLAFGPALAAQRPVQVLRYAGAAILVLWGVRAGMAAFGL